MVVLRTQRALSYPRHCFRFHVYIFADREEFKTSFWVILVSTIFEFRYSHTALLPFLDEIVFLKKKSFVALKNHKKDVR